MTVTRSYFPDNLGGKKRPAWCVTHQDIGWVYSDGSGACIYTYSVEMGSWECEMVAIKVIMPSKMLRRVK